MNLKSIFKNGAKVISTRSSLILTVTTVVGVITTAVVTYKAAPEIKESIDDFKEEYKDICEDEELDEQEKKQQKKSVIKRGLLRFGKAILPVIAMIIVTCAACISSHRINMKRQAALAIAYETGMKALQEYQDKAKEVLGEAKEKELIRDKIAEDKVKNNPPVQDDIIATGDGNTLFYDPKSGRYFRSSAVQVRKAWSRINQLQAAGGFTELNRFYELIGLDTTDVGEIFGWNETVDGWAELEFDSCIVDDEPCAVLDYRVTINNDEICYSKWDLTI